MCNDERNIYFCLHKSNDTNFQNLGDEENAEVYLEIN